MKDAAQWKKYLREKILESLDYSKDMSDAEVKELVEEAVVEEAELKMYPVAFRNGLSNEVFNSLRRLDILQMFVEDPGITEIMINGTAPVFVERNGCLKELDRRFESEEKLLDVIQQIVADCNRSVNEASPIVDARLKDGSRVNIVMKPVALNGPILTIRRFPEKPITIEDLLLWGTITSQVAELLKVLVKSRYNIFISGGTGSGKTTFLNVLSGFIPSGERVITIEDNAELQIQGIRNLVRLETRQNQAEGCREISIRSLIRTSLRMRPEGIKIKKGKLKRKKKRIPIPHTFLQHILGNLIPLIRGEVVKIIEEADDLLPLFHSILHVESILPIHGVCTQHSFSE